MNKAKKLKWIEDFKKDVASAESILLVRCTGLTAQETLEIRSQSRNNNVKARLIKNSLAKIALNGSHFNDVKDHIKSQILAFTSTSETGAYSVVKLLEGLMRLKKAEVICGGLKNEILDANESLEFSNISSIDDVRASIIGMLQGPQGMIIACLDHFAKEVAKEE